MGAVNCPTSLHAARLALACYAKFLNLVDGFFTKEVGLCIIVESVSVGERSSGVSYFSILLMSGQEFLTWPSSTYVWRIDSVR